MQRVLDETREQSDEHLRALQRAAADFANYRRRIDEERAATGRSSPTRC